MKYNLNIMNLIIFYILQPLFGTFLNKRPVLGFSYSLIFIILYQTTTSILTQYMGIFNYGTVFIINIMPLLVLLYFFFKNKVCKKIRFNWLLIFSFIIIFIQLWSVHNSYSGEISTINGYESVENMTYRYPYFSDEWINLLFTKNSIETGSLAVTNPMNNGVEIKNLLVPYFSFISNFFLLSQIDYVENYFLLPLITGMLILLTCYWVARVFGLSNFSSIITIFLISYITNGSNLPGIWYTLPYTIGLILFLINIIGLKEDNNIIIILSSIIGTIIYPPIFIFMLPAVIFHYYNTKSISNFLYIFFGSVALTCLIGFLIFRIGIKDVNIIDLLKIILNDYIFRNGLDGGIPNYSLFTIIPFLSIILFPFGFYKIFRDRIYQLLIPISIGIIYWIIYSFTTRVFIIEYTRVVTITSILIVIVSGFSINDIIDYGKDYLIYIKYISFGIIIFCAFNYTGLNKWENLKLFIPEINRSLSPAAPANKYLHPDDLIIFNKLDRETFIAPEWKGLVIGVMTNNIPMKTKPSIIANNYFNYRDFMNQDCAGKLEYLNSHYVNYVYSEEINCDFLMQKEKSSEELFLYKKK